MSTDSLEDYAKKFNELQAIFDSLPDGIVAILDNDFKIVSANKAMSSLFEMPGKNIIGKKANELFEQKYPVMFEILQQTIQLKKEVRNFTIDFTNQNGVTTSFLISSVLIEGIGQNESAAVLIIHDISEIKKLRKVASQFKRYGEIVGDSEAMRNIYSMIDNIKNYDTSVLIIGETGTGKELVARAIHDSSNRKEAPFIPIHCSALPQNLIESELFGHIKGAYTGAAKDRQGRFKMADKGTIFLDELGTLNLELQVKLLRVLQQKTIEPVGSSKSIPVNVRIISASNRDLSHLVEEGLFREDLLYRLKVFQITLPPLRKRTGDVSILTNYFIQRLNHYYNKSIVGVSNKVKEVFNSYPWPGNVRELENSIEHAFVLTNSSFIEFNALPIELQNFNLKEKVLPPPPRNLNDEESNIRKALLFSNGNIEKAADLLEIHRSTLWRKMKEFRIDKGFGKTPA
ncbi:MAG: Fis family transcriptional regulator [Ignavibacteriae bacterium HGW-Ignavibacteriae-3]|nr:MAG: Fis family transcriptional regulator [Ignavibacteriae bacterium HGW-Ignavibacteriae-3]